MLTKRTSKSYTFRLVIITTAFVIGLSVAQPCTAKQLRKLSGDNQIAQVGSTPVLPFTVRVTDMLGNPVVNYPVNFTVTQGGGCFLNGLLSLEVDTDTAGTAAAFLTLGQVALVANIVEASAQEDGTPLAGSPVIFHALSVSSYPTVMRLVSGDNQLGAVGTQLPIPLVVKTEDKYGNPSPSVPVEFAVAEGDVMLKADSTAGELSNAIISMSDNQGISKCFVVLGQTPGPSRIEAGYENIAGTPVNFFTIALAPTGIESEDAIKNSPNKYELFQNYPNPFNPSTTIGFQLAEPSQVTLTVFDLCGKKIRGLFGGRLPAGNHSISWDGCNMAGGLVASGIYLYRIEVTTLKGQLFTSSHRMLLLK